MVAPRGRHGRWADYCRRRVQLSRLPASAVCASLLFGAAAVLRISWHVLACLARRMRHLSLLRNARAGGGAADRKNIRARIAARTASGTTDRGALSRLESMKLDGLDLIIADDDRHALLQELDGDHQSVLAATGNDYSFNALQSAILDAHSLSRL